MNTLTEENLAHPPSLDFGKFEHDRKTSAITDGSNHDQTLDVKGLLCPIPIVKTFQAIQKMSVGQILEVLATDPGSKPDIDAWSKKTGHKLLKIEELPENPPVFRFLIRKSK